jgi:hypothetical protein
MSQLTLELPNTLMDRLARLARQRETTVEHVAAEQLQLLPELQAETLEERYDRFFRDSSLFVQVSEEEKARYADVPDEVREDLARKCARGKPLSEMIIEDRGPV